MSRFRPDGFYELLTRTFEILEFQAGVYVEIIAPDLRPAALVLLISLCLLWITWAQRKDKDSIISSHIKNQRLLISILLGWSVSWISWLLVSGNGRYAIPMLIFSGPFFSLLLWRLPIRKDWFWLVLTVIFGAQGMLLNSSSPSQGWSMLKTRWAAPDPFPSIQSLLSPFEPDVIITPQSQTMMALMVNTPIAKNSQFVALDFAQAMGNYSPEHSKAMKTINQSQRPILLDSFSLDFALNKNIIYNIWQRRYENLLNQYGLSIDESSCRNKISPLNVMQIACKLTHTKIKSTLVINPAPQAKYSMERLIRLCGNSLWPLGAKHVLQDGSLVQIFRESRYTFIATIDGSLYVRRRQDINFELRWLGHNDTRPWESIQCNQIINGGWLN